MKAILEGLESFLGLESDRIIYFAGIAMLWLILLPITVRICTTLVMWFLRSAKKTQVSTYTRRRTQYAFWLAGASICLILFYPVFVEGKSTLEGIYFRIMGTPLIIAGVMLSLVVVEHLFLQRISQAVSLPINWCDRIFFAITIFMIITFVLDYWGLAIAPILGSLGLIGIAVGLGAQDMFSNMIAGLLILLEKRLSEGDVIEVGGTLGTVQRIGLRSTLLEQFDKTPCYVPNAMIAGAITSNHTRRSHRRIIWSLGLEYGTSAQQLRGIRSDIEGYLTESHDFLPENEATCMVRLDAFADSSINMYIHCFANTADFAEWMMIKENLLLAIKEIVEDKHKAGFAFPSMTIYKA